MIEKIKNTDEIAKDADANADAARRKCRGQPTLETELFTHAADRALIVVFYIA